MRQQAIFLNKVRTNNAKVTYSSMENMDGVKRNIVTNFLTSTAGSFRNTSVNVIIWATIF